MTPGLGDASDGPPHIVLWAVGLLGLLFLFGGVYLFISGPFTGVSVVAPADLPPLTAVLTDYRGTIFGVETARARVKQELARYGLAGGQPITVYPESPWLMRPIDVSCRVGYLLVLGRTVPELHPPFRIQTLAPGRRLIVRVRGRGDFTGSKAYKAAVNFLRPWHLQPAEGERYEVKIKWQGRDVVEHWIPVQ